MILFIDFEGSDGFTKEKAKKFSVVIAESKKHIPGAGNYKIEHIFNKISRPYTKNRY